MLSLLFKQSKDKKLGVAEEKARYDLPLHKSAGSRFLMLLVALMSFLAMMAVTGSYAMHDITTRWSSGLENQATIEIPARTDDGNLRSKDDLAEISNNVSKTLAKHYNVKEHTVMSRDEIAALVSPWLGDNIDGDTLPLPGLISVHLKESSPRNIEILEDTLHSIAKDISIDTHENWLNDILRLTGSLQITALVITLVIGLTTVMAIAGAIQSRMAEFRGDIELLHLMGASNNYISRQFQRHSVQLAFYGSLIGLGIGVIALILFSLFADGGHSGMMPNLIMSFSQVLSLCLLPLAACVIAYLTARFTVLRTLSHMPL